MVKNLEEKRDRLFSVNAVVERYKEFIDGISESNYIA